MSELVCDGVSFGSALRGVTLRVPRGRCVALVGPTGAGKSTLLWLMAGLWRPTAGRILRDGGRLGMVFQDPALWDHLTVEQHVRVVDRKGTDVEALLARTGLTALRRRRPAALSGGERQRLSLARALAVEPDWLLLDEPMAHLDGAARHEVFVLLREIVETTSAAVVLATHHAPEAMRLADEVAVMIAGRIVQRGPPEAVYRRPVDLAAARVLGPASEIDGMIVRPDDVRFRADPSAGPVAAGTRGRVELGATDLLQRLLGHDRFMTRRLIEHARGLDDADRHRPMDLGPGTVHDTLHHIVGAMSRWAARLADVEPGPAPGERCAPDELLDWLAESSGRLRAVAAVIAAEGRLDEPMEFRVGGMCYRFTRGTALVHIVTHGMHHRAQVFNMLRRLGRPADFDGDAIEWELAEGPATQTPEDDADARP